MSAEEWVPAIPDDELMRLAEKHGESYDPAAAGPLRCNRCGERYPCDTLRLAVELIDRRGLEPG